MSTTSCAGNSNPVSRLFQDAAGISSSKTLLSNIEQGRRNTTNSFRSSTSSTLERGWTDDNREWDNYFQQSIVHGGGNQFSKEFPSFFMSEENKEEEEEFRQEWSDEHFTQLYIEQNALELHNNIRTRRHSCSQTNAFVQEFLQNSSNNTNNRHQKITTDHCDLFQAQLYLFDHFLSAILAYPITPTFRPSATAEWNWGRLFSPTRWCNKEEENDDEDDKILQNEHLKHVAIGRLQLLLGHLIINANDNKQKEKSGWEWEWEFYNS